MHMVDLVAYGLHLRPAIDLQAVQRIAREANSIKRNALERHHAGAVSSIVAKKQRGVFEF